LSGRKRLLFVTHYFPPEVNAPANRTYEHCRAWMDRIDVTVVTNFPNHPDGKVFPGYKNKLIQKESIDGIDVIRLWTFITPNEGFILRTLNYLIFMLLSVLYVSFSGIKFDLIMSTTPQFFCGLAGKYISILRRKPFILELRDLWPESIVAVGALTNKKIIKLLEWIEINLYKSAKKIISVTVSFKENLVKRGIKEDKIHVFFNGVDTETFDVKSEIGNEELKNYLQSGFKIGYIGTIGMAHSIITLIEAAEKLKNTDIKFVIVGSGAERQKLEDEIEKRKLKNIRIFPIQPKSDIPAIIEKLDLFCVHLKKNDLFKTVIPSKMFEGMIKKKPILMGVEGESRKIIENARCGIFFEPENSEDLVARVLEFSENGKDAQLMGHNGHNFVMANFNRKKIAAEMIDLIEEVM